MKKYIHISIISLLSFLVFKVIMNYGSPYSSIDIDSNINIGGLIFLTMLSCTSFLANVWLWYFYPKNSGWRFSIKQINTLVLLLVIILEYIITKISAIEYNTFGEPIRYDMPILAIIFIITTGFFWLKFGAGIIPKDNTWLVQTNKIQIKYSVLVISNVIWMWLFLGLGYLLALGYWWVWNNMCSQPLCFLTSFSGYLIALVPTILSFCAWLYYDRWTRIISRRGFIFSLMPYTIPLFYWATVLLVNNFS